jgi:hypothetical protein
LELFLCRNLREGIGHNRFSIAIRHYRVGSGQNEVLTREIRLLDDV